VQLIIISNYLNGDKSRQTERHASVVTTMSGEIECPAPDAAACSVAITCAVL